MKSSFRFLLFATTLLSPALLFNCAEDSIPEGAQFSLVRQHLQLQTTSASFGFNTNLSQTISVAGENTPWALTGLPDWLSASATTGQGAATITLTAKENTSVDEARAAVLTFASTAGDYQYSKTISVSQPAATIYITPSAGTLSCLPKGETKTVTIASNVDWAATASESWLTVKKASNTELQITATENLGQTRTATIHLMRTGTTTTITTLSVTQAEAGITGSTATIAFMADGETKSTTFHAEASWTASASDAAWLRVTSASGSDGDVTLTITATANASANARSGFVYVKIGTATKLAVPVSQEGVKFSVSASALTLKSTTESATLDVTANAAWQVVSKPEWVKVTLPETLVGTNVLTLTPQDNPDTTPRTGQLIIGREGFSGNQSITVSQEGKTFGNLTDRMDFPVTAATQTLTVETDGAWTASTTNSWIHLSPTNGQGNGQLQVRVDANPDKDERTGAFTITVGQTTQTVTFTQAGRNLTLFCDDVLTKSAPTTVQLSVSTNADWTASSSVDWLTVEPKQGEGNAQLTITVADNPSVQERNGTIMVKAGNLTQTFSFTQPGCTLSLSISTDTPLTFPAAGGTSDAITVISDGIYTITPSDTWLTIKENVNTFTITAAANDGAAREGSVTVALTGLKNGERLTRTISVTQYEDPDPLGLCPNKHHPHAIDMGLGVKFACCNVGASSPDEYGDYFAWGETSGYNSGKTTFDWSTYKWCNGSYDTMTKYCNYSYYGTVDNKVQLELSDDAARANWGSSWRMPTIDELAALNNSSNCDWTPCFENPFNGKKGWLVTSRTTGNSIFLPAAGNRLMANLLDDGSIGYCWSSTLSTSKASTAYGLYFNSGVHGMLRDFDRYKGPSVRPVIGPFLTVYPSSLSFTSDASSEVVYVNTEADYTITISESWIKVSTSTDKTQVTIAVTNNTASTSRSGTITLSGGELTQVIEVTQTQSVDRLCPDNNHPHAIDMGLGVKFACCNVGALSPDENGDYFAWGETETKSNYDWSTYKWCNGSSETMTKYCNDSSYGTVDNKTQLELSDDAARVNWGGSWRMPTIDELSALNNSNTCDWTPYFVNTLNGKKGWLVTSRTTGNSIFLPVAGYRYETRLYGGGYSNSFYLSSSLDTPRAYCARILYFDSLAHGTNMNFHERCHGWSVRPVTE